MVTRAEAFPRMRFVESRPRIDVWSDRSYRGGLCARSHCFVCQAVSGLSGHHRRSTVSLLARSIAFVAHHGCGRCHPCLRGNDLRLYRDSAGHFRSRWRAVVTCCPAKRTFPPSSREHSSSKQACAYQLAEKTSLPTLFSTLCHAGFRTTARCTQRALQPFHPRPNIGQPTRMNDPGAA